MKRNELDDELRKLNVPPSSYSLEGDLHTYGIILSHDPPYWTAFYQDVRGERIDERTFFSEDEACDYILHYVKKVYNYEKRELSQIVGNLSKHPPLQRQAFKNFLDNAEFSLPDQLDFLYYTYNGMEGRVGKESFLKIWPIETLAEWNGNADFKSIEEKFFVFGNGNFNNYFAFGKKDKGIFELKNLTPDGEYEAVFCADNVVGFFLYLFDKT